MHSYAVGRCCLSCFASVAFALGFGGQRCDGSCVGGVVGNEEAVGSICVGGGVGEEQERGGFDGTRGLIILIIEAGPWSTINIVRDVTYFFQILPHRGNPWMLLHRPDICDP